MLLLKKTKAEPDISLFGRGYRRDLNAFGRTYLNIMVSDIPDYYISEDGILYLIENQDRKEGEEYTFKETSYKLIPFTLTKEIFDDLLAEAKGSWLIQN